MDCSDHDSDGSHDLIGSFTTTVSDLQKPSVSSMVIKHIKIFLLAVLRSKVVNCVYCFCALQVEFECIHPEKQKKKKSYKNSGVVYVKSCKVETTLPTILCWELQLYNHRTNNRSLFVTSFKFYCIIDAQKLD